MSSTFFILKHGRSILMLSNIFQRSQNFLQVIKMFAFVIATFLTCWFPYHAYFVYSYHNPEVELPILSDYSFVFVILFVIDNLHHPGSPIYHFVYSNHNPEVVLSFSSIELPSNLSCCFSLVMSGCHCVGHFHA